jgi:hypothetical protein
MKRLAALTAIFLMAVALRAQTVPMVVQTTSSCATSVDGNVVGLLNPQTAPSLAVVYSGTLAAGTYYVEIAWLDGAGHTTLASPETSAQLSAPGSLQVAPPAGMPALAVGMGVYIGAASGVERLQGTTSGSAVYTQASALTSGAALPAANTTLCQQVANDAGRPPGTGYNVSLIDSNGNALPGYPMQWQLLGPGATYSLNNGLPLYSGVVDYPVPVMANPYNHVGQSIGGPLSLSGYSLTQVLALGVGTQTPGWPIDNELGATNSLGGYIVNGGQGVGTGYFLCAGSDAYHTFMPSATPCNGGAALNYQTILSAGTAMAAEPALNFLSPQFILADHPGSPAATTVALNLTGSEAKLVTAAAAGSNGNCAKWDALGGVGDSGSPCNGGATMNVATGHVPSVLYTAPSNAWLTVIVTGELYGGVGHSATWNAVVNGSIVNLNGVTNSSGAASVTFEVPPSGTYIVTTGSVAPGDDSSLVLTNWVEYTHLL